MAAPKARAVTDAARFAAPFLGPAVTVPVEVAQTQLLATPASF